MIACFTANAQFYMGGSLNLSVNSTNNDDGEKIRTTTTFGIQPEFGYYLSSRWDVGLSAGLKYSNTTNHTLDTESESTSWNFSPFVRYAFIQAGKFEVLAKGSVFVNGSNDASDIKTIGTGASITPLLAYNLTERFALLTSLNFFSFGYTFEKVEDGNSTFRYNFGVDSNNVINIGAITIGCIFKF